MIMLPLLVFALHGFLLQALPITPIPWFGVSLVVALAVIMVAAVLYMIAPILNSNAMQQWSRFQIYEALLSVALIILFLGVVKLLFLNPQQGFASASLVPQGCTATNTIYQLSTCDLAQFNTAGYTLAEYIWAFSLIKGFIPNSNIAFQPVKQEGDGLEFSVTVPNILDAGNSKVLSYVMGAVLGFLLLSQIQLVVLSSSLLLLSFFFSVGLIARVFGISRSFGGAMIAFGIGLGIIYPLLVSITYGYIDVSANTWCLSSLTLSLACAGSWSFSTVFFSTFVSPFSAFATLFAAGPSVGTAIAAFTPSTLLTAFSTVFNEIGYLLAGLIVMPIINILIVDVFVIDFSRAVGEQMSFSMLFKSVV
jgi:hypothetical protein